MTDNPIAEIIDARLRTAVLDPHIVPEVRKRLLADLEAAGLTIRKGWRPLSDAPKDGSVFYMGVAVRWVPYKKGAPAWAQRKGGRFQKFNGYGWENLDHAPDAHWLPRPTTYTPEQSDGEGI